MPTIDALRDLLWQRDGGICGICGCPIARAEMQIDHIWAHGDGGPDSVANLRAAHAECNRRRTAGRRHGPSHPNWGRRSRVIKFLIRLPADLRQALEQIANEEHRSLTNLIVHALREWLAGRGRAQ